MKKMLVFASRHRNAVLFGCALAFGILAAVGTRGYISQQLALEKDRLKPKQRMTQVVVAKRDLGRGDVASADTMATRQVPVDYLSATAITPERFEQYAGARLTTAMRAGEPLLSGALEGVDVSTFSAKVRDGIRAVTVTVDEVNSISGMLQPGDRIDLLLSIRMPGVAAAGPLAQEVTRPLMQDLRVLATGRRVRPGQDESAAPGFTAITVEVDPNQAQKLVVAQRIGKLTAMLRNPRDRGRVESRSMDIYGLLGITPAPAPLPLPGPQTAEVIVGGQGPLLTRSSVPKPIGGASALTVQSQLGSSPQTGVATTIGSRSIAGPQLPEKTSSSGSGPDLPSAASAGHPIPKIPTTVLQAATGSMLVRPGIDR
jgi:pilus assembly protein CpaB